MYILFKTFLIENSLFPVNYFWSYNIFKNIVHCYIMLQTFWSIQTVIRWWTRTGTCVPQHSCHWCAKRWTATSRRMLKFWICVGKQYFEHFKHYIIICACWTTCTQYPPYMKIDNIMSKNSSFSDTVLV